MNGYAGKILRVNLTCRNVSTLPTARYEQWVGGHGMGSAIFFDLVKDKTIDGFDPANVVTLMTSPLSGTLAPAGAARTEVQAIGVQSLPIGWYTRSNFGGRFSAMLKYAGWDGIVIEGRADDHVWLDIRNDTVTIRNCSELSLWGTDTWECLQKIFEYVAGKVGSTGTAEPKFLNAVTGKNFSFLNGIELGKKIWNLDHAIWTLQGRHRDMVHFADYFYTRPSFTFDGHPEYMPGLENGKWHCIKTLGRHFDRNKFEEFKSRFYTLQGWETRTGYPTAGTLKSLGLDFVAAELEQNDKLGKG